jgi:NAD(P)-dependent dehydrogenase (short-subunit alcohol dehydrogenase family)
VSLDGRTAIVTGGASGIGKAIVERLARDGADVAIWDLDAAGAARAAQEVRRIGRRAIGVAVDVSSGARVSQAAAEVREALGAASILVNGAGIGELVPLVSMTDQQWDRMIAIHLTGTFLCTRAVLPGMIEIGWGRIVGISSVAGISGAAGVVHYSAAKAGIIGFTKALAQEVAQSGITVNSIAPGLVDTPILEKAAISEDIIAALVRRMPVRRIGRPEDIAAACAYIVSEEAGFLTGQVVSPNGGGWT